MTTTPAETAAYVAASIALGVKSGGLDDVLSDFDKAFNHVLHLINSKSDNAPIAIKTQTVGPRNIPVVSQEEIKAKIAGASVTGSTITSEVDSSSIVVHGNTGEPLPNGLAAWCKQNNITHVYDNRAAQAENPRRPAFKAVDSKGHDIKVNGKTLSFWENTKTPKVDTPMPDAFQVGGDYEEYITCRI